MLASRQTRRNTATETRSDPLALDPWSDDSCRDFLLRSTLERLDERASDEPALLRVRSVYAAIFSAPSPSPGSRDSRLLSSVDVAEASERRRASAGGDVAVAGGEATAAATLRSVAEGTPVRRRREHGAGLPGDPAAVDREPRPDATPLRAPRSDAPPADLMTPLHKGTMPRDAADTEEGASPVAATPTTSSSSMAAAAALAFHADPATLPPLDDIAAHFQEMLRRGVVLERLGVKDLQFVSFMLRGSFVGPRKREPLLMELRTFYYETLKSPRKRAGGASGPNAAPTASEGNVTAASTSAAGARDPSPAPPPAQQPQQQTIEELPTKRRKGEAELAPAEGASFAATSTLGAPRPPDRRRRAGAAIDAPKKAAEAAAVMGKDRERDASRRPKRGGAAAAVEPVGQAQDPAPAPAVSTAAAAAIPLPLHGPITAAELHARVASWKDLAARAALRDDVATAVGTKMENSSVMRPRRGTRSSSTAASVSLSRRNDLDVQRSLDVLVTHRYSHFAAATTELVGKSDGSDCFRNRALDAFRAARSQQFP